MLQILVLTCKNCEKDKNVRKTVLNRSQILAVGKTNSFNKPICLISQCNLSVVYTNADVLTRNKLT